MKKTAKYFLSILISFAMILAIGSINKSNQSFAYQKYNDFVYSSDAGVVTIRGYIGDEKNVTIPEQIYYTPVAIIAPEAFVNCEFENITIPKTVTNIGGGAFFECYNLKNIIVDKDNINFSDYNGILYNKNKTTLIKCPRKNENPSILDGTTKIEDVALASTKIKNIVIPDSVKYIGGGAFYGTHLNSITIPNSVNYIDTEYMLEEADEDYGYIFGQTNVNEIWLHKDSYAYNFLKDKYKNQIKLIDKKSTLNITGQNYPKTISYGSPFTLTGKITSNYKLISVSVQVLDKNGKAVPTASKEICPYSYTYSKIDSGIKFGTLPEGNYTYKVIATDQSGTKKTLINKDFKVVKQQVNDVTGLKYTSTTSSTKLSWNKTSGANGYEVWMYKSSLGDYTKVKTITSSSTLSYTRTDLTSATMYRYKVRAYKIVTGVKYYGDFTDEFVTGTKPLTPYISVSSTQKGKIKVTWSHISSKTTGYQVYRATSRYGTYTRIATIEDGNVRRSYTDSQRTSNKTYYYKVRAYRTLKDGSKVYSSYSSVKSIKAK